MKTISLSTVCLAALFLAGCADTTATAQQKAQQQEASLQAQHDAQFAARCDTSHLVAQEIVNLCNRARRINVQNMQSCITLFAKNGAVVGFFPVKGKVSSLNSYLLPGDQVNRYNETYGGNVTTESPDIDGAYGKNADGIFFFTADSDAYVEWQGDYFWSDQCLAPTTAPLLVRQVAEK